MGATQFRGTEVDGIRVTLLDPPAFQGREEHLQVRDQHDWVDGVVSHPADPGKEALEEAGKRAECGLYPDDVATVLREGGRKLSTDQGLGNAPEEWKDRESKDG
jgi:hypothetical protein